MKPATSDDHDRHADEIGCGGLVFESINADGVYPSEVQLPEKFGLSWDAFKVTATPLAQ